jgi:uncharacterized repeat protein (TIGR01451 family)
VNGSGRTGPIASALPNIDLTVAKSHTGTFNQGNVGQYTITVSNIGTDPTIGTVTVTDTLPSGLTAIGISGTGWTSCTATPVVGPGSLSCQRSDALARGSSYPAITLTVSVANGAPATVTNSVRVAGGGEVNTANDSASDPTSITQPIPTLSWWGLEETRWATRTRGCAGSISRSRKWSDLAASVAARRRPARTAPAR